MKHGWKTNTHSEVTANLILQTGLEEIDDFSELNGKLIEDPNFNLQTQKWGINLVHHKSDPSFKTNSKWRGSHYDIQRRSRDEQILTGLFTWKILWLPI
ncbi:MAG: hypothetical protein R2827_15290 [Bdellovibrionales bacterium]